MAGQGPQEQQAGGPGLREDARPQPAEALGRLWVQTPVELGALEGQEQGLGTRRYLRSAESPRC